MPHSFVSAMTPDQVTRLHALGYAVVGVLVLIVVNAFGPILLADQIVWFLLPAVVFGLFHGGGDPALAEPFARSVAGRRWYGLFGAAYSAVCALAFAVWWIAPTAALVVFLCLSIWHFGGTDTFAKSKLERLARGALLVFGSYAASPELTAWAFSVFAGTEIPSDGLYRATALAIAGTAAGVSMLMVGRSATSVRLAALGHLGTTIALFAMTPPLVAFACYFAAWHSLRHMLDVGFSASGRERRFLTKYVAHAILNSGIVVVAALLIYLSEATGALDLSFIATIVFVGLYALTVPHFTLVDVIMPTANRSRPNSDTCVSES